MWQLVATRRRYEYLTGLTTVQAFDQPLLPVRVQLRKHVVQDQGRLGSRRLGKRGELDQLQRDCGAPLLAGGAVLPERPSVELEYQIVAMGPDRGRPLAGIDTPRGLERVGPCLGRRQLLAPAVPHADARRFSECRELPRERHRGQAGPSGAARDDLGPGRGKGHVEGAHHLAALGPERGIALSQDRPVPRECGEISAIGQAEQPIHIPTSLSG
ncbi:MAG TPA: hypothetical protein VK845_09150 [Gemmatimonadales bacterium]|nr:hypothetical protein [Gemmatimonadales bacterium]